MTDGMAVEALAGAEQAPAPGGRWKPYPAYKDSGVEWLGEIPAHWSALGLGPLIARIEQGRSPVADDRLADVDEWAVIKLSAVSKGSFVPEQHKALPENLAPDKRYEVREGDFLLTRANTPDLVGDVCVVPRVRPKLMLCDLVYRLRFQEGRVSPRYLAHWLLSKAGRYQIEQDARGSSQSMVKISQKDIRAWTLVLPPSEDQLAIVRFLERETAKIDALMAKKEWLIELLRERRSALITHVVTNGLDSTVPRKDSGLDWLGEIPAHWDVKRWRYCCHVSEGQVAPNDDQFRKRILIAPNHIESDTGRILYTETAEEQGAISGKYIVNPGDIIYSKIRPALNKVCVSAGDWLCSADMYPITITDDRLHTRFLLYFMLSQPFVRRMIDESMRVAMPKVNRVKLAECELLIPSDLEQRAIATFLDRETARIDTLISKVGEAIKRLKELRTAVISAAVTGKIDVREEAA